MAKKILVLLANNFEEIEVITPLDIWRRVGFTTCLASINNEFFVTGQQGLVIKADMLLSQINRDEFDMLFIPGGSSQKYFEHSSLAMDIIKEYIKNNKIIIAICSAPVLLASYLKNKQATCYPAMKNSIHHWHDTAVVIDLPFITSQGAGTSAELAFTIVELFTNTQITQDLKNRMIFK